MNTFKFLFIILGLSIFSLSCTKEVGFTKEQLFDKAKLADPSVSLILPRNLEEGIKCSEYSQGCMSGHTVRIKGLDIIAVEFATEADAIYAAKKYRGYYVGNWFLDDVVGEPILEEFVVKALEAKRP